MSDEVDTETGPINSSYLVFFHAAILFVAPFVTAVFPAGLRDDALMVALVFPFSLFWFFYLVKQFLDPSTSMNVVLSGAFVVAALSLLNAAYGNLSTESVPVVYTQVPFFATLLAGLSGPPGLIYAGTILTYGAYVYIICVGIGTVFEWTYENYGRHLVPKKIQRKLLRIDAAIDKTATKASDKYFIFNQAVGLAICVTLIVLYAALYTYFLIK